jgi:hypothetical protein
MRKRAAVVATFTAAAALLAPAVPASAEPTIHPLVCSELSSAPMGTPANTQNPPGITQPPLPPEEDPGPDQSQATTAQPVLSVLGNPTATEAAFKPEGC